jgi:hypothetical protein
MSLMNTDICFPENRERSEQFILLRNYRIMLREQPDSYSNLIHNPIQSHKIDDMMAPSIRLLRQEATLGYTAR